MTVRRPRTAAQSTALPSLAALLASGVAVEGCDSAAESAERSRRLTEHGQQAGRELDSSQHGRAATEVAIGLGLIQAPPETRISSPGEAPVVQVEPSMHTAGVQAPTQLTPPVPAPVDVDGGIRRTDPTPPVPPATAPDAVRHRGVSHTAGSVSAVSPRPPEPPRVNPRGGAPSVGPGGRDPVDL